MASFQEQLEANLKTPEAEKSEHLDNVIYSNRAQQIRKEIGFIADRSIQKGIISEEAYQGYKDLERGQGSEKVDLRVLETSREFAQEHEERVLRIHKKISAAKGAKYANEKDEEFLIKQLDVKDYNFDEKADWFEKRVDEKLGHMKQDKERYAKLANHKLVKNVGYLKVDANTKIDIPKEDDFMKLNAKERRVIVDAAEKALPKAEKHHELASDIEDSKMTEEYAGKLKNMQDRKILGNKSAQKFMDGFSKIDNEEKEAWLSEFDAQMERYENLWGQIRETLQGDGLQKMESLRDKLGYTELLSAFGRTKQAEGFKLGTEYAGRLQKYKEEGVIGRHTVGKFNAWMTQQKLEDRYTAVDELGVEMERYEKLWEDASQLTEKQQAFMRSKIDDWGYTELSKQLADFKAGKKKESGGLSEAEKELAKLRSSEVREAIEETGDWLNENEGKKSTFQSIMTKMFGKVTTSTFDATSFEGQVRQRALEHDDSMEEDLKGRGADDVVDLNQVEEDADFIADKEAEAEIINHDGFIEVESWNENGEMVRDTQVQINDEKSMNRLLTEDSKQRYKAEAEGGNDDMSLSVNGKGGRTVEMSLEEIKVLDSYLKKAPANDVDEDDLDKVA